MPLQIDPKHLEALIKRQVESDTFQRTMTPPLPQSHGDLNPSLLAVLGGAADGASTYRFMKNGFKEDNAAFGAKSNPVTTGLAVAGTGIAVAGAAKLLGRKYPELARAILANHAATQIAYAGRNISPQAERGVESSSAESYNNSITQAIRRMHSQ